MENLNRRKFLFKSGQIVLGASFAGSNLACSNLMDEETALSLPMDSKNDLFFKFSLAEWSLHKSLWAGKVNHLDFASIAKNNFGITAIEYVNQFFFDKAEDRDYLLEMKQRADDLGVKQLLIMIDLEGSLATLKENDRKKAIENHYKWIDAAKTLGCHSIRVNSIGKGDRSAVMNAAVDSLGKLTEYSSQVGINVLIENHGGYSSDANWLANVMKQVNSPYCGTLPDFGNFRITMFPPKSFDREKGLKLLLPFAKGISAKSFSFDRQGHHIGYEFSPLLHMIKAVGYTGHIGIEYEGYKLSEEAGIKATKQELIKAAENI